LAADARRARRGAAAHRAGLDAEELACAALAAEGWEILARRLRTEAGEIDIIAANVRTLAFVEVKTRPSLRDAALSLTPRQQARLWQAAEAWLAGNPAHAREEIRLDVILIAADGSLRRVKDAIRL
jgi:putative endonuclease